MPERGQLRLHSAIGYVAPADKLLGLENVIHAERDRKLEEAREVRRLRRQRQAAAVPGGNNASPTAELSGTIDFRGLRGQVTTESVLDELGYLAALRGVGPQRRGPCPLHDDPHQRHRSFSVHLGKGLFRCFHPQCQAQGNVLDLWARHTGLPLREAAVDLASRFAVTVGCRTREEEPVTPACRGPREPVN